MEEMVATLINSLLEKYDILRGTGLEIAIKKKKYLGFKNDIFSPTFKKYSREVFLL